jgi:protein MpaA
VACVVRRISSAVLGPSLVAGLGGLLTCGTLTGCAAGRPASSVTHIAPRVARVVRRHVLLGHSVRGRDITATELGSSTDARRVFVIGVIHGDESAGAAIVRRLARGPAVPGADLWLLEDLNPDGVAAATRTNADGVDLNRNFPYRWRRLGRRGDQQYSGPRALSEPEARIAHALILRQRPQLTLWFHQPLGVVDESGGSTAIQRRLAGLLGLPLRRLTRYPGSVAGWQNHRFTAGTALVVELPAGPLRGARLQRAVSAVRAIAR